jgi:hypothetical protein
MESSFTIRVPRWSVFVLAALLLVGGGIGAGLAFGGGGRNANADVAAERKPTTSTSTQPSTTTSTAPLAGFPGAASSGGGNGGGNEGAGGGGAGAAQAPNPAQPPAPPAATASVSKSANCPTVVSWSGTGGTNGYTLQVYNAVPGGATLYNGPVGANGQMSFNCVGAAPIQVPVVGLVRFNTNTATGTVSDTA